MEEYNRLRSGNSRGRHLHAGAFFFIVGEFLAIRKLLPE